MHQIACILESLFTYIHIYSHKCLPIWMFQLRSSIEGCTCPSVHPSTRKSVWTKNKKKPDTRLTDTTCGAARLIQGYCWSLKTAKFDKHGTTRDPRTCGRTNSSHKLCRVLLSRVVLLFCSHFPTNQDAPTKWHTRQNTAGDTTIRCGYRWALGRGSIDSSPGKPRV